MGSLEMDVLGFCGFEGDNIYFFFFRNPVTEMQLSLNTEVLMK